MSHNSALIVAAFHFVFISASCTVDAGNPGKKDPKPPKVSLFISDSPIEQVEKAILRAKAVRFLKRGQYGTSENVDDQHVVTFPSTREIDLLDFSERSKRELLRADIPEGTYPELRIVLDREEPFRFVYADGTSEPVAVPPGNVYGGKDCNNGCGNSGSGPVIDNGTPPELLLLGLDFSLKTGENYSFNIDVDFRKSLFEDRNLAQTLFPATWNLEKYRYFFAPVSKTSKVKSTSISNDNTSVRVYGKVSDERARAICFYSQAQLDAFGGRSGINEPMCDNAIVWSPVRKSYFDVSGLEQGKYYIRFRDGTGNTLRELDKDYSNVAGRSIEESF